jgi:hypothetical protein
MRNMQFTLGSETDVRRERFSRLYYLEYPLFTSALIKITCTDVMNLLH